MKDLLRDRMRLPVWKYRDEIKQMFSENRVCIVVSLTGSGKTTQIPQFVLEELEKTKQRPLVGCTQPRRVAAMSIAARVADEMGVALGDRVGYTIRFEDKTNANTRLRYMTDGILLRDVVNSDAPLEDYDCIILDEVHERSVQTDLLMGFLKPLCCAGKGPKLILMSATMDAQRFSEYFNAPVLTIPGVCHSVEILHTLRPVADYVSAAIQTCVLIHSVLPPGDVLLFLSGEDEIREVCFKLPEYIEQAAKYASPRRLLVLPLYSSLSPSEQLSVFRAAPANTRKIVVCTNIAETSITIDGIAYVVDAGVAKMTVHNPRLMLDSLLVTEISKSSANQRAGRAGRTRPGRCFRLYTQEAHAKLLDNTPPEIQRCSLTSTALSLLKKFQRTDVSLCSFDYMDPPHPEALMRALEQLELLGALDTRDGVRLTRKGHLMARFPVAPEFAKIILESVKYGCVESVLSIVAMLNTTLNAFFRPSSPVEKEKADVAKARFAPPGTIGDFFCLLNVFNEYNTCGQSTQWCYENYINPRAVSSAVNIREQLQRILLKTCKPEECSDFAKFCALDHANVMRCFLEGYFMNVAHLDPASPPTVKKSVRYQTLVRHKPSVYVHPSCCVPVDGEPAPEWILYHDLVLTTKEFMRTVNVVQGEWLFDVAGRFFRRDDVLLSMPALLLI